MWVVVGISSLRLSDKALPRYKRGPGAVLENRQAVGLVMDGAKYHPRVTIAE
jgi:hypothetical protein